MTTSVVAQRTLRELERLSVSGLDSRAFRRAALRQIKRVVPVDAAMFANADPASLLHTDAVVDDILRPYGMEFLRTEFLVDDVNQFRKLARSGRIVGTLDVETAGRRERSPRYMDILEPLGLGDELLRARSRFWLPRGGPRARSAVPCASPRIPSRIISRRSSTSSASVAAAS
jgi:hypothetical protein